MNAAFCRWYSLSEASVHAPELPGVYQVKLRSGLLDYPGGKSAMVHYAAADCLRLGIEVFATQHLMSDLLCRHVVDEPGQTGAREALYRRLLDGFIVRFGEAPRLPVAG